MYTLVWDVFKMTGLVFFAFLAVIVEALKENFESDEMNDAPHQQLGRIKVKLVIMVFILIFVASPVLTVSNLKLRVPSRQCEPLPTIKASEINLTDEERDVYAKYGVNELVRLVAKRGLTDAQIRAHQFHTSEQMATMVFTSESQRQAVGLTAYSGGGYTTVNFVQALQNAFRNQRASELLDDMGLTLSETGRAVKVPIWWHMIRNYMLGVGAAIQAGIPCDNGIRLAKQKLEDRFITDELLRDEFGDFYQQCHAPAYAKWHDNHKRWMRGDSLVPMAGYEVKSENMVPGNKMLLIMSGYYDAIRAKRPVYGFGTVEGEGGYTGNDDAVGSYLPAAPTGFGYPLCDEWWTHPSFGLERRLIEYYEIDTDKGKEVIHRVASIDLSNDESEMLEWALAYQLQRQTIAANEANMFLMDKMEGSFLASHEKTSESEGMGSVILGWAVDLGTISDYVGRMSGLKALLRAMPIATSVLIMFFMAILPVGMVIGRFSLGPTMGLTMTYVSFYLWTPYFRLVKWIDDNFSSMLGMSDMNTHKMMVDIIIGAAYIAVPMLITSIIAMAGVKLASFDPLGAGTMGSLGQKGVTTATNAVKNVAKKAATRGMGK